MVFSTDSDLSYTYLQYKNEKFHRLFGLGWKNQEHTVTFNGSKKQNSIFLMDSIAVHGSMRASEGVKYFPGQQLKLSLPQVTLTKRPKKFLKDPD